MPRLAVLGQPISHSRSPAMQRAALEALGLAPDWSYEAVEVAPEDFERRVEALAGAGYAGANVTLPHKLAALRVADRPSPAARAIGAANTLSFTPTGIEAENTDAPGLIEALPASPSGRRALVLGAGGSARACAWGLREAGAEVEIWNRTAAKARELAASLGAATLDAPPRDGSPSVPASPYGVIVNATTIGMDAASSQAAEPDRGLAELKTLPFDADSLSESNVVVDLVYGSATTPLVKVARERGAAVVDGLEILVRQGALSLRIWTGLDPPLDVMRDAVRNR